jgi:hypothetical protein
MPNKSAQIVESIRTRLGERAIASAPQWLAPALPAARNNALSLLIGRLCGKLPAEDASALVSSIVAEQNEDGSWPVVVGGDGDMSVTLEVVEALTTCGVSGARDALSKAVVWLQAHRYGNPLDEQTVILLSSITEVIPAKIHRFFMPLARLILLRKSHHLARQHGQTAAPLALSILTRDKVSAPGYGHELLGQQLLDGSWEGSSRSTILAMAALRHASLPGTDAAFERGWRFLRSLQLWNENGLIQNPCDASCLLHASAIRSLLVSGADDETAAGSTLSLLHCARTSGGWGMGGMQPTDLLTTATALDGLSFAGDDPVETTWARRRAVLLLLATQNLDGGWPLYPDDSSRMRSLLFRRGNVGQSRSRVDVTAIALQALAYSGVRENGLEAALSRGISYLLRKQESNGLWRGDTIPSDIFATARSLEALLCAGNQGAARAVSKSVRILCAIQKDDGGWGDAAHGESTPHHTAWALRALTGAPGVDRSIHQRGQMYLERTLDPSELLWSIDTPAWPLPLGEDPMTVPDLTALWALEALVPAGIASRKRTFGATRIRSLFDRSQ